jgi:uncharacterized membrane protein SirB2
MPLSFATIKHIHMGAAALSIALFVLRGGWMLWSPQTLRQPWVKLLPHVIDTVLLAAALWLAWQLGAGAMRGWLVAKIVGLFVYVALGTIALKRGRTRRIRVAALVAAVATFGYIVMVAVTKSPLGVFAQV